MRRNLFRRPGGITGQSFAHFLQASGQLMKLKLKCFQFPVLARDDLIQASVQLVLESRLAFQFFYASHQNFELGHWSSSCGSSDGGSHNSTRLPSGSTNQPKRP